MSHKLLFLLKLSIFPAKEEYHIKTDNLVQKIILKISSSKENINVMNIRLFFTAAITFCAFAISPVQAADVAKGESLSQTCLGCHGVPGLRNPSPVYRVPMIGGQHASYIEAALKAYKSKERSHPTMQAQAANLSESDIKDIAAYFANLKQESKPFVKAGAAPRKSVA